MSELDGCEVTLVIGMSLTIGAKALRAHDHSHHPPSWQSLDIGKPVAAPRPGASARSRKPDGFVVEPVARWSAGESLITSRSSQGTR